MSIKSGRIAALISENALAKEWSTKEENKKWKGLINMSRYNFCIKCGSNVRKKSKGKFACTKCGYTMYVNPRPSTAAVIMRGNKIMFVKRAKAPFKNWWDLPGGFLDEKETPEECVVRECREETGLVVKPVKILGFKNDQYNDLRVVGTFILCKIVSGREKAGSDASAIKWFDKNELPKNVAFPGMREGLRKFVGAKFTKRVVK